MPIVILHDDPRIMANAAQGVGAYRAGQDAQEQDFRERQFGFQQDRSLANDAYVRQHDAEQQAMHLHDQLLEQEERQRLYDQQIAMENLRTQNDLAQEDKRLAFQAGKQEDDQQFRAGEADKKRGFETVKAVGGAIEKGIAGFWNTITGNTPAARQQEITKREQMRSARSDTWRQLQQQNRLDEQKRRAIEKDFEVDISAARFRAEKASSDARQVPTDENKQAAADAMEEFVRSTNHYRDFLQGTQPKPGATTQPAPAATQPAATPLFGPTTDTGFQPAPGAGMGDVKQADRLTPALAAQFLQLSKGDKNRAREAARAAGYAF